VSELYTAVCATAIIALTAVAVSAWFHILFKPAVVIIRG